MYTCICILGVKEHPLLLQWTLGTTVKIIPLKKKTENQSIKEFRDLLYQRKGQVVGGKKKGGL